MCTELDIWSCIHDGVTLGDSQYYDMSSQFQEVFYDGKIIGVAIERIINKFTPIHTTFLSTIHCNQIDSFIIDKARTIDESESRGYNDCYFACIQDMVDVYTHLNVAKN